MSSFYMTLPSNSSMQFYPNNTLTNYVTKLPQPFDLSGEWEVGLSEIQFPITWYNVKSDDLKLEVLVWYEVTNSEDKELDWDEEFVDVTPPAGHYESADQLVKQINANITRSERAKKNTVKFHYNEISKRIAIRFGYDALFEEVVRMSQPMAELLGFECLAQGTEAPPHYLYATNPSKLRLHSRQHEELIDYKMGWRDGMLEITSIHEGYVASRTCDLQRGFYSLFVYCDIAEPTVVGDAKVPLLRTVNVSGKEGATVSRIYQNILYVPVQRKQFDTIEIDIRDDTGRSVPFERGRVVVTLHFKLKKPAYF